MYYEKQELRIYRFENEELYCFSYLADVIKQWLQQHREKQKTITGADWEKDPLKIKIEKMIKAFELIRKDKTESLKDKKATKEGFKLLYKEYGSLWH
jgi:hypothetical protein